MPRCWSRPLLGLLLALAAVPGAAFSASADRITAGVIEHWPPQYRMEGGEPSGFAVAVMDRVADRAGLAVDYQVFETFPQALAALREERVDVIPNLGITPQRQEFVRFTVPVETFQVVWFVRAASTVDALPDLRGRKVAVVAANIAEPLLGETRDIQVEVYPSLEEAVFALLNGQADALVYPRPVVNKLLRESGLADRVRVVGDPLVEVRRGIGVARGRAGLHQRLEEAARGFVGSEAYREIYTRWYGPEPTYWTPTRVAWVMGGVLAVVVLGLLAWRYWTVTRLNRRLRRAEAESRLAARAMDEAAEGVVITTDNGRVERGNRAFTRLTGFASEEVQGRKLADLQEGAPEPPADRVGGAGYWQGETQVRRRSGELIPVWQTISAVRDESGAVSHYVVILNDITELKAAHEELDRLAHRDALTGLPNRLLFTERLEQALRRARREGGRLAVLFLDLDGFKDVNDALGHHVGDELLQAVAGCLRQGLRESDTLARMGGDEFILLAERLQAPEDAAVVARKALGQLDRPFTIQGHTLSVGASVGIALYPDHGDDVATLIKYADAAMYRAKETGRNRYCFFTAEMATTASERLRRG